MDQLMCASLLTVPRTLLEQWTCGTHKTAPEVADWHSPKVNFG